MPEADLGRQIGWILRATRVEHDWSQETLSDRLGVSQSTIARLESAQLRYVDLALVTRAFHELGIRSSFDANTIGLAGRREQRDVVHSVCEGYASRRLGLAGWDARLEVEVGTGRWRGWIDLLAFRHRDRALLIGEVKSALEDIGRLQRTLSWYEREAWRAARSIGWRPAVSRTALFVLASDENDERLIRNGAVIADEFSAGATELGAWIGGEGAVPSGRSIALIDPNSRRAAWLIASRSQGRRTPVPYRDYADAAERLKARSWRPPKRD
jgi:transcriptional regulator with XRE-family HTH domain